MAIRKTESYTPPLTAPRFKYINHLVTRLLKEYGDPQPPMPLEQIVEDNGWLLEYSPCFGPLGYMVKIPLSNGENGFAIRVATDIQKSMGCSAKTAAGIQYWTLAHEIGHILLHGNMGLNTTKEINLNDNLSTFMEVEANWFAARLLMPNYIFTSAEDLIPRKLANKCNVNLEPATKRINNIDNHIYFRLKKTPKKLPDIYLPSDDQYKYVAHTLISIINPESDDVDMLFNYPLVDDNLRIITCYRCGNENFSDFALHCKRCGTYLYNECLNDRCASKNVGDANFCEHCGHSTIIGEHVANLDQNGDDPVPAFPPFLIDDDDDMPF